MLFAILERKLYWWCCAGYCSSGSINAGPCVQAMCIVSTLGGGGVVSSDGMMCTLGSEGRLDCFVMCTLGYEGRLDCLVGIGTLGVMFDLAFGSGDFFIFCALVVEAAKMSASFFSA